MSESNEDLLFYGGMAAALYFIYVELKKKDPVKKGGGGNGGGGGNNDPPNKVKTLKTLPFIPFVSKPINTKPSKVNTLKTLPFIPYVSKPINTKPPVNGPPVKNPTHHIPVGGPLAPFKQLPETMYCCQDGANGTVYPVLYYGHYLQDANTCKEWSVASLRSGGPPYQMLPPNSMSIDYSAPIIYP